MQGIKKFYQKFKNMSPVAKTSMVLVIAKFFQKGLAMLTAPIFTRIMPSSEYGVMSTFTSWQSVLYIVTTLNMAQGVFNNGMTEFKKDRDSFCFSLLTLANLCTLCWTLLFLGFRKQATEVLKLPNILVWIMIAYFFATPAYNYWMGKNRFEYKYRAVFVVSILSALLSTGGAVVAVLLVPDSFKAIAKVSASELVAIVLGLVFAVYLLLKAKGKVKLAYWKYALVINLPLIPHYLSMYVLSSSDRIMITELVNTSATAIYNVAYNVASVILIFWNAVDAAYAPWIYQRMDEKNYAALQKRGQEVIVLFAGCAVFVTLFAPELIRILGPEEYYPGVYVIPAVVAGVFFTAMFSLYVRVEMYLKKSTTIMVATVGAAVANLVLNYIFIPRFGFYAAGYTTLACYILLAVFHAVNLKHLGYGHVYDNRKIAVMSVALCAIIIATSLLYTHTVIRYLLILALLALGVKERKKLLGLVKKQR